MESFSAFCEGRGGLTQVVVVVNVDKDRICTQPTSFGTIGLSILGMGSSNNSELEDFGRTAAADADASSTISATRNCSGATFHASHRCKFQAKAHTSLLRPVRKVIERDANDDDLIITSADDVKIRPCFSGNSSSANPNNHSLLELMVVEIQHVGGWKQ
jgi:hypothetical protein